jgi:hypothetical protein
MVGDESFGNDHVPPYHRRGVEALVTKKEKENEKNYTIYSIMVCSMQVSCKST